MQLFDDLCFEGCPRSFGIAVLLTNDNKHDSVRLFRVVPKGKRVLSMILPRVVFQDTASDIRMRADYTIRCWG